MTLSAFICTAPHIDAYPSSVHMPTEDESPILSNFAAEFTASAPKPATKAARSFGHAPLTASLMLRT